MARRMRAKMTTLVMLDQQCLNIFVNFELHVLLIKLKFGVNPIFMQVIVKNMLKSKVMARELVPPLLPHPRPPQQEGDQGGGVRILGNNNTVPLRRLHTPQ